MIAEYTDAQALASEWHTDATLYAVTVKFSPTLTPGEAMRVYIFGSPSDVQNWWLVTVNEQTGERIRAAVPKADYLDASLQPAPIEYWKVNAIQALQIAETNGGQTFREQNPGAEITASLSRSTPNNWLWWIVRYRADDGAEETVRVHPETGEVYDETGSKVA